MSAERIHRLKCEYCYALDNQDASRFVKLFHPNATLGISVYGEATGREELREFIEWVDSQAFSTVAHMLSNPVIDVDGDHAVGRWYYLVVLEAGDGSIEFGQGCYRDEFEYHDGEWRFVTVRARRGGSVML